jgi:TRAP-type C4-dicarboxylate transport system substrate-binding protein
MQETKMRSASRHLLLHFRKAFTLACTACLALATPAAGTAKVAMRIATAYAADNFQTVNLQRYADEVAQEVCGQVRMTIHKVSAWIPKNVVFISRKIFDRLDSATQKKLSDTAHAAEERGWTMSRESDRQFEAQLAANRVAVSTIDPFLRRYLDRLGENLAREWLKKAGSEELKVLLQYTTERSIRTASKPGL